MSDIFNPIQAETVYPNIDYTRGDYQQGSTFAEHTANATNSFNMQYMEDLVDGFPGQSMSGVGVYNQIRNRNEYALIRRLVSNNPKAEKDNRNQFGQDYLKADQLLDYVMNSGQNTLKQSIDGNNIPGMSLVYLPPNNGDQYRMFGKLMVNAVPDSGIQITFTEYSLASHITENALPGNTTSIAIPADYANQNIRVYFSRKYTPFFTNGAASCTPLTGDCAEGYRRITIIKPRKGPQFNEGGTTLLSAGTYGPESNDQVMHGYVYGVAFDVLGDGGYALDIRVGTTRYSNNGDPLTFEKGLPFNIEVGDILLFGNVDVSTQCLPEVCCAKASPRVYSYCSTTKRVQDCVFSDRQFERYTQNVNELSYTQRAAYEVSQKMRDLVLRLGNTLLEDRPNYAQGQRAPIRIPGSSPAAYTYNENTVIPNSTRGILPTIDDFGKTYYHSFTSNHDNTGHFVLEDMFERAVNSIQASTVHKDSGWMIAGAVKELQDITAQNMAYNNVMPNTLAEAQNLERIKGLQYDNGAKSLFGSYFDAAQSNELGRFNFGFGKYIQALDDETLKVQHPDTVYLLNENAVIAFAADVETIEKNFMGVNYYLPPTGKRGLLTPYVYTQDLVQTYNAGQFQNKTRNNCNLNFYAHMEFGFHTKAPYVPHQAKIKFSVKQNNPLFNPALAENAGNIRYLYYPMSKLGLGGSAAQKAVRDSLALRG